MDFSSLFQPGDFPVYEGKALDTVSFPIGGLGAGMFCLGGTGSISRFSLRHRPDLFNEPVVFSAMALRQRDDAWTARVLEGPVPNWKFFFPWNRGGESSGMGAGGHCFGLPRFDSARFASRFPFAAVELEEKTLPVEVSILGWSPFVPGDADASSLPAGALEYTFHNRSAQPVDLVYSFHAKNFMARGKTGASVAPVAGGFVLRQEEVPDDATAEGSFAAWVDDPAAVSDLAWFRGGWFDSLSVLWKNISSGRVLSQPAPTSGKSSEGGSVYLPLTLAPGEKRTVRLLLAWHVPYSGMRDYLRPNEHTADPKTESYRPWYASVFRDLEAVTTHWRKNFQALREATATFTETFYASTLPPEVLEAVAANLSILKSPTVLREEGGRLWGWEGCQDDWGSCHGTCTHVWNYAQAVPHLFPKLERGLREVEFLFSQDEKGHQNFRAALPLRPNTHTFHAASDGQLGGIVKIYRDWRISGDTPWLRSLWPKVRDSLNYCIETWDPDGKGQLFEPHHNTYDIEFWGPDGMCGSFYLAALAAAAAMGRELGEPAERYETLLARGRKLLEGELFNGDYVIQKIMWKGLRADPLAELEKGASIGAADAPEARLLMEKEGPKYQYGEGCLADGVLGEWMAWTAGMPPVIEPRVIASHLAAVFRHNFRADFAKHANPQRPSYAYGDDAGLLACTWPRGGRLTLPFVYSEEAWTGIEYQVASHLISVGRVEEGLRIVRAVRSRYDGTKRNPYDEIECGHWYARALASYALLQALGGARYDAVDRKLYLAPAVPGDYQVFLATEGGYGLAGLKDGKPFLDVRSGKIDVAEIVLTARKIA